MPKIEIKEIRHHSKASEKYVDVIFHYPNMKEYITSIPIEYRRTGIDVEKDQINNYLSEVYEEINPSKWNVWHQKQKVFWATKPRATITKSFFDILSSSFKWCCVLCELPENPNWARRTQDLKEFGYTISTITHSHCLKCKKKSTQLILVPLKRGINNGYENWSSKLREHIMSTLESFDSYEGKKGRKESLLPDHKFPEIRWNLNTRRSSLESLTDDEIKRDFQLLSNQRNQQKREVCRECFQTGNRGIIYGIPFFYQGSNLWNKDFPERGKEAERGCVGCGWYDINKWRNELIKKINK